MIFEQFQDILSKQLNVEKEKITVDSDLSKDFNADSLDIVEMLMEVESTWGITISDEVALSFKTVGDVVDYIETAI